MVMLQSMKGHVFQKKTKSERSLREFLGDSLPQSERKEIEDEFKKTLSTTKGQKAKKIKV